MTIDQVRPMEPLAKKVLLVGWDAADWQVIHPLLDAGKMPFLEKLIDNGVMGNLATLEPALSPMLWTSIATGKTADEHGVQGFIEPAPKGGVRPVTCVSRKVKALWNILQQNGLKSNVVGWWPSHPAEPIDGCMVSNRFQSATTGLQGEWPLPPWPMSPGTVHPQRLAETLAEFRFHPSEVQEDAVATFMAKAPELDLGEGSPFVKRVDSIRKVIAECTSVHGAATYLLEHEPWDLAAIYYDAIDHFSHLCMGFHPPRRPHIPKDQFEAFHDVVESGYRYHDLMLGRLMELAGDEATIILISDHGFESGEMRPRLSKGFGRPGPAAWHRPYGIFVMSGPGVQKDRRVAGAGLLDIAPTVLRLFGLPAGADMGGRVLAECFEDEIALDRIPSWEEVEGECGMHEPGQYEDPWEEQEMMRQLADLGYIEEEEAGDGSKEASERAVQRAVADRRFNLSRVLASKGKIEEAAGILEELVEEQPEEKAFSLRLAHLYLQLGRMADCRRLAEAAIDQARKARIERRAEQEKTLAEQEDGQEKIAKLKPLDPDWVPAQADFLLGCVAFGEGDAEQAMKHFHRAEDRKLRLPDLHIQMGRVNEREQRWVDAERSYRVALTIDEDNAAAWNGVAQTCIEQGDFRSAVDAALRAVGLRYAFPDAHRALGIALAETGKPGRAKTALQVCLKMNPRDELARERLDRLQGKAGLVEA